MTEITIWMLDPAVRVVNAPSWEAAPGAEGPEFVVSSPSALFELRATAYQLRVLWAFRRGDTPEAVMARHPFEVEATRAFIARCQQAKLLREADGADAIRPPDRVSVQPRCFGAPDHDPAAPAAFTVLGIPFDGNTTGFPGARFGPLAIRSASEGARYTLDPWVQVPVGFWDFGAGRSLLAGVSLADAGNVYVSPGEDGFELYARITDVVRELLEGGTIPIVLGGDHSLTAPVLAAFPEGPLQIVHLDAHTDLGDLERSDGTGLHHGSFVSALLEDLPHLVEVRQIGLRGIIESSAFGDDPKVVSVGMDQLRERGWSAALDGLDPDRATYVTLDIDVVDPAYAPSTGTPVPGGLAPHELKALLRTIGNAVRVVGMDVMEVGRPEGAADGTGHVALEAIMTLADAICERMLAGASPGSLAASL